MSDTVPNDILDILKRVAKNEQYQDFDVNLKEGNKKGEGYLGEIIFVELIEKKSNKLLTLVIKRAFTSEKIRSLVPIRNSFLNEIYFYTHVWPLCQQIQNEYNLEPIKNVSKHFDSCADVENEYLVLENLRNQGFSTYSKAQDLTRGHVELIFNTYGRIHGTVFAIKKKYPEKFAEMASRCKNIFIEMFKGEHFPNSIKEVIELVSQKLIAGEDDQYLESFKKYLESGAEIFKNSMEYMGDHEVLLHGDCWSNNMMFKYNDDGSVSDIKIIDWQLIQAGSPAQDLCYCLYSGAAKAELDDLDYLQKLYHNSLTKTLSSYGIDVNDVYPLAALKKDWLKKAQFGMIFSFLVCKMKLTDQKDAFDLKDMADVDLSDPNNRNKFLAVPVAKAYDTKVRNLIRHMYDIGAL